jgi:hypothetical protein
MLQSTGVSSADEVCTNLLKIWGFHGGDYDDYHLPEDDNHQIYLTLPVVLFACET